MTARRGTSTNPPAKESMVSTASCSRGLQVSAYPRRLGRTPRIALNLVRKIRIRRHKWLGHILRAGEDSLMFHALKVQSDLNLQGNLLMDAPRFNRVEDLIPLAMDRASWRSLAHDII